MTITATKALSACVDAMGGSARQGQIDMTEAVEEALAEGQHLLVQAGTGTGKSLAYLVPALIHAVETNQRVVVSTATLALQAQLVDHDLPLLVKSLAPLLKRKPTFSLLKGRSNYICRHKLDGGYPEEEPPQSLFAATDGAGSERLGAQVVRLREWAESSKFGDRDHLPEAVADRAWSHVSVSARSCLGQQCPMLSTCFSEQARERAKEVDLVVTNHAYLAIDVFGDTTLLPEHDVVIVDEAHELAARVTSAITEDISSAAVRSAARSARSAGFTTPDLDAAAAALSTALDAAGAGRLRSLPEEVAQALILVGAAARTLHHDIGSPGQAADAGAKQSARQALQALINTCDRVDAFAASDVVWVSDGGATGAPSLHVAPMSVATSLKDGLFARQPTVLTSATLSLGGSFDTVARAVGVKEYTSLDVGSPFDYAKQGILYVAAHLNPPGREGADSSHVEELTALIKASHGGALGLFSSRRAAEKAAEYVREHTNLTVYVQGEDSLPSLVRDFIKDTDSCLFGSLSLWQGIDAPGQTCRLVVIDRIPFPRPDDPLQSARSEAVSRHGGNGFMAVSATHAALLLAQGAGRLIRRVGDRGVVAVLDSRLANKGYGGFLTRSMPPMWRTKDPAVARQALQRLAG